MLGVRKATKSGFLVADIGKTIPRAHKKEYLKYYDRLTVGVLLKQYIGYQNMSNNKLVNFTIGIEIIEGFKYVNGRQTNLILIGQKEVPFDLLWLLQRTNEFQS